MMAGLYIHVPFCRQKCHYCNFYSLASRKFKDQVVTAILREIELQKMYLGGEVLRTIYFGGGTPSLLEVSEVKLILQKAEQVFGFAANPEITIEVNPDDITPRYLAELKKTPVNRMSIGIQSFDDADLISLNRRHTGGDALQAIRLAKDEGFTNLSCDLIYGIPGSTDQIWRNNIQTLVDLNVPHISAYALTVEKGTALDHLIKNGKYRPVDEEQTISQFVILMEMMEQSGYDHYEISNFSYPGKISKHNSAYWTGEKYLGLGPSAHSFDGKSRQWNVSNIKTYVDAVSNGTLSFEKEELSEDQKFNEFVLTSLRTMWGIDLQKLKSAFGESFYHHFLVNSKSLAEKGYLILSDNKATLTRQGKLLADQVTSELFIV